jgi:Ser/Thr protein kinase RdoA (MazF antagonist)
VAFSETPAPPAEALRRFERFGRFVEAAPLSHGERASNQHYRLTTAHGESFVLKSMRHAASLFPGDAIQRIATITTMVIELGARGMPVEHPEPTDDGQALAVCDGTIYRLYRWIAGSAFEGAESQIAAVARAQRQIHDSGVELLDRTTRERVATFGAYLPLDETRHRIAEVVEYLRPQVGGTDLARILEEALEAVGNLELRARTLVHLDLHPDNVLFDARRVVLLDWDNARIDDSMLCVALSVARFAATAGPVSSGSLRQAAQLWSGNYGEIDLRLLALTIARVELEKILRITLRAKDTGTYADLLNRIQTRHLPTLLASREWHRELESTRR